MLRLKASSKVLPIVHSAPPLLEATTIQWLGEGLKLIG